MPAQIAELRVLARDYTPEALEAIVSVMSDTKAPPGARVAAASELLDRGRGRPTAAIEYYGPDGAPVPISLSPVDWDSLYRKVTGQEPTVPDARRECPK